MQWCGRCENVTRRSMRGFRREVLQEMRERKGWTPGRLAREAGLGATTIRQYEQGLRTPGPDRLARVAAALGVGIVELVEPRGSATLSDLRVLAGLTQPQLGAATGISTSSISALESGEIKLSRRRAELLADALGVSADEVVEAWTASRHRGDAPA